ncbi:MAG TPA: tripartite tricarboxylate transporter substrate-binding protein [Casimicrobiaceae bacterium]|nr:tripartite tricarboxylate transporter substrate-binding protein [Casimicrobiaceae bacterium]
MLKNTRWVAVIGALLLVTAAVRAQTFPTHTIRLVSGVSPGSASDTMARIIAEKLQASLGQPVIVENKLGAGGLIGAQYVARAEPDGHTIMIYTSAYTVAPLLTPEALRQDELTPVAAMAIVPTTLVTSPAKGYKTLADLVAAAKAKPGGLVASSAGIGSSTHMNLEKFRIAAGIDVLHVPLKGAPEALTEVLTGRADMYFALTFQAVPYVREGKLVALAMGSPKRSALMPEVPTTVEAGYPNSDYNFWVGALVSSRTPREIVQRLHREITAAVNAPDIREQFLKLGADPLTMSQEQFEAMVREEFQANAKLIKSAGIKAN